MPEEEVTIPVSKQCQLLQSYYVVASRLLGGDFVGGEMVWWRDDCKLQFHVNLSPSVQRYVPLKISPDAPV